MDNNEYQKNFWQDKNRDRRRHPGHSVVKEFVQSKIKFIQKHILINPQTTLLDVGCGNGYFTVHWAKLCQTTGMDYSKRMLINNPHPKLVLGDVNQIPFGDNTFDIVFCSNLLHHLDNLGKALLEMKRVSKKYVIISEPNRNNPLLFLFACLKKEEKGILSFTRKYLIKQGLKVGLKIRASQVSGLIVPNKIPVFLLPFFKKINLSFPLGVSIEIIFTK